LQRQVAAAIAEEGGRVHYLPSGAGHDGMALIEIAPIGMLFVRCKGGISHNPAEAVTLEDVATGARVFARFIASFTSPRP
jgi:allantoate deiminase